MSFEKVLRLVSTASILIPVGVSLVRLRSLSVRFPTLLAYLWLTVLVETWGFYTMLQGSKNNGIAFNFYSIGEFVLLSWLYYRCFELPALRRLVLVFIAMYVPFALYRYSTALAAYDGLVLALENFLLIVLVLLYFYRLLHNLEATRLSRFPLFWFSTGILMYFAGSFFIFMFSNYILTRENYPNLSALWSVTHYLNIVFHLALATGIWYLD